MYNLACPTGSQLAGQQVPAGGNCNPNPTPQPPVGPVGPQPPGGTPAANITAVCAGTNTASITYNYSNQPTALSITKTDNYGSAVVFSPLAAGSNSWTITDSFNPGANNTYYLRDSGNNVLSSFATSTIGDCQSTPPPPVGVNPPGGTYEGSVGVIPDVSCEGGAHFSFTANPFWTPFGNNRGTFMSIRITMDGRTIMNHTRTNIHPIYDAPVVPGPGGATTGMFDDSSARLAGSNDNFRNTFDASWWTYSFMGDGATNLADTYYQLTEAQRASPHTFTIYATTLKVEYVPAGDGVWFVNYSQGDATTGSYSTPACRQQQTSNNSPAGYADYCMRSGNNTIIYGWAYDPDAPANDGNPTVNLVIGGTSYNNIPTDQAGYRTADINGWLDTNGYAGKTRGNTYGFVRTVTLTPGSTNNITGIVNNYGAGSNASLGINTGNASILPAGAYFFANGQIPPQCLPPGSVTVPCGASTSYISWVGQDTFVTMQVTNTVEAWNDDNYRLGFVSPAGQEANYFVDGYGFVNTGYNGRSKPWDPLPINNGQTTTFSFHIPGNKPAGNYTFNVQMVHDGDRWFGNTYSVCLTVKNPSGGCEVPGTGGLPTYGGSPYVTSGSSASVTVRVTNTSPATTTNSTGTWDSNARIWPTPPGSTGYSLANQPSGSTWTYNIPISSSGAVGSTITVTFSLRYGTYSMGTCQFAYKIAAPPPAARKNYIQSFDNDVWAGGTFDTSACSGASQTATVVSSSLVSSKFNVTLAAPGITGSPTSFSISRTAANGGGTFTSWYNITWSSPTFFTANVGATINPATSLAGGTFTTTGTTAPGVNINTYVNSSGTKKGAGTSNAAIATGTIAFLSRIQNLSNGDALLFGNTASTWGNDGNYTNTRRCMEDYYTKLSGYASNAATPTPAASFPTALPTMVANGGVYVVTGPVTISNALTITKPLTIIVNGDVTVSRDIIYSASATPASPPFFMLVSKGNIRIGQGAHNLHGVYAAQPSNLTSPSGTDGWIDTCYTGSSDYSGCGALEYNSYTSSPFTYANSKTTKNSTNGLYVRGSLVAYKIKFHRSYSDGDNDAGGTTIDSSKAAEALEAGWEMYMLSNPFSGGSGGSSTSAPPVIRSFEALPPVF